MRYGLCFSERNIYRSDLWRAAQRGGPNLSRFVHRHRYLFAEVELTRLHRQALVHGWDSLAHFVNQKFRSFANQSVDPRVNGDDYPTICEVIITPHNFLKHALEPA